MTIPEHECPHMTMHDDNTDPNITDPHISTENPHNPDPHISTEKRTELSVSFSVPPSVRENPVY